MTDEPDSLDERLPISALERTDRICREFEAALKKGEAPPIEILALDEALGRLEAFDARKAKSVELHYFGGMTYEEAAGAMEISPATFHREIRLARAWLQRELGGNAGGS